MIALLVPLLMATWHPDGVDETAWTIATRCRERAAAERTLAHRVVVVYANDADWLARSAYARK